MPDFQLKIAETTEEVEAAQRLRYQVFVKELGGGGPDADHALGLEQDRYDEAAHHLLLIDRQVIENSGVVGTYRLMTQSAADKAGGFYSAQEFDLSVLMGQGRRLLELGRSCIHPDYRGGTAMYELWAALAQFAETHEIDVMFGVASFHGTDVESLREPLGLLARSHLAQESLRVAAKGSAARALDPWPEQDINRRAAMTAMPALIKGYLRLGGTVGDGAWVDHAFNTTDVCMILERSNVGARQRAIYARGQGAA